MVTLIRLFILVALIAAIYWGVTFYRSLGDDDIAQVKKDVISVIDTGEPNVKDWAITDKVKEDLGQKKASFLEELREKLKGIVHRLFD